MALDPVPTYPGNYDAAEGNNNPPGSDSRREGDDQIRRMKASEKATWTNITGAVTANHNEINRLVGVSLTDIIVTFTGGNATKQIFYQDTAPTDWVIEQALDEHAVRLTKGSATGGQAGGSNGGTINYSTVFKNHPENDPDGIGGHAVTLNETAAHNHGGGDHDHDQRFNPSGVAGTSMATTSNDVGIGITSLKTGLSGSIITQQGGGQDHYHSINLDAKWAACILCSFSKT